MAADLRMAQMGAPVYKNSKNNPKAPIIEAKDAKHQRANTEITASEVRLVKPDGTHKVLSLANALQAAQDAGLDLVEVAGDLSIPTRWCVSHIYLLNSCGRCIGKSLVQAPTCQCTQLTGHAIIVIQSVQTVAVHVVSSSCCT